MSIDQYLLFVAITGVFLLSPGPSVILSINNGIHHGIKRALIGVLGNVVAFQLLIVLSALGLGAILTASSEVFFVLKIFGALYLVYLGIKIWRSAIVKNRSNFLEDKNSNRFHLFKQAFLITSSNPKALVYVSALLPQFINTQQAIIPQVFMLGLTSAAVQFLIFSSYVVIGSKSKQWFENPKKLRIYNRASGVTFIGFGVALGLSENKI